jgi:hypothetical protein
MPSSERASKSGPRCPVCGKPSEPAIRPFCSRRCADVDLARWLGGTYAIAGHQDTEEDGSAGSAGETPPQEAPDASE